MCIYFRILSSVVVGLSCQAGYGQHNLDGLLGGPPSSAPRVDGTVKSSVLSDANASDTELRKAVDSVDRALTSSNNIRRRGEEGVNCKLDCYEVTRRSSDSFTIKCKVGSRAGERNTIWKYSGSKYFSTGTSNHKDLDLAARFVCNQ